MNLTAARSAALKIVQRARAELTFDLNPSLTSTILLTGCGRSGTTWLGRVFTESARMREIYEPFDPDRTPELNGVFEYREYIRWSDERPRLIKPFEDVLSGAVKSPWADGQSRPGFYRRRLVKEIRLCQSLGWVAETFPSLPIVHVVRSPYWNAQSRMRLGWPTDFSRFTDGPLLDRNPDLADALTRAKTPLQKHAWLWAMDNSLALGEVAADRATVVFYEDLVNHESSLRQLVSAVGLEYPESMPAALVPRPSRPAPPDELAELDELRSLLPIFGLYDETNAPDPDALASFLGSRRHEDGE